jgi:hypothetical protein
MLNIASIDVNAYGDPSSWTAINRRAEVARPQTHARPVTMSRDSPGPDDAPKPTVRA